MPSYDQMVKRQRVLAEFGDFALRSDDLDEILTHACQLVRQALDTDFAKIMEIDHGKQELFVRAGVGWPPGIVGQKRLPLNVQSSEAYSVTKGEPVVTQNMLLENRFEFADFLKESGVVAIVNVPIFLPGKEKLAYGLLQVDNRKPRDFVQEDQEFLRTYATILGPVIDRLHKIRHLQVALDTNRHLLVEMQHRIKNHIGIISSLVSMRHKEVTSEEARQELKAVGDRVETLRLVHEQLYIAETADHLELRPYVILLVENLCRMHSGHFGKIRPAFDIGDVQLTPEKGVPVGLILNEFVTNSLKYAFGEQGGIITVSIVPHADGRVRLRLSDDGRGLSVSPRVSKPGSGTGMKIINGLARQLGAEPTWTSDGGTALCLEFAPR